MWPHIQNQPGVETALGTSHTNGQKKPQNKLLKKFSRLSSLDYLTDLDKINLVMFGLRLKPISITATKRLKNNHLAMFV